MNNKIALHGSAKKLKQIEGVLTKLFNKNNIPFEIHLISDSEQFLREFLIKNDFRLFMVSEKGTVSYMMKMYKNFDQQTTRYACGKMNFPLTQKEFSDHMLEAVKSSHSCPYGIYAAKNAKMSRLIQHSDIECIYRDNTKSVFYLQSGETMEVPDSISRIYAELDANYFIKCSKGVIVNFFNIEQVSDDYKTIITKSGAEIPMSRIGEKRYFKSLSLSIAGVNVFNY